MMSHSSHALPPLSISPHSSHSSYSPHSQSPHSQPSYSPHSQSPSTPVSANPFINRDHANTTVGVVKGKLQKKGMILYNTKGNEHFKRMIKKL